MASPSASDLRHLILNEEPARLAHMARYVVRPPVAMDRVHESGDGQVVLDIPPDHRTGATTLSLDPLEWLIRVTNQLPEKGSQLVRYFGKYPWECASRSGRRPSHRGTQCARAWWKLGRIHRSPHCVVRV